MDLLKIIKNLDNHEFPENDIKILLERKAESTPLLLNVIKEFVEDYKRFNSDRHDHIIAIYILAQFKEKSLLPYILKMLKFPSDYFDRLFEDPIECFPSWILSVFNGDLDLLKNLIENESIDIEARNTGFKVLMSLYSDKAISKNYLREYFKFLLNSNFTKDFEFSARLIEAICSCYLKDLYNDIIILYKKKVVDTFYMPFKSVDNYFTKSEKSILNELSEFKDKPVEDALKELEWIKPDPELDKLFESVMNFTCCNNLESHE